MIEFETLSTRFSWHTPGDPEDVAVTHLAEGPLGEVLVAGWKRIGEHRLYSGETIPIRAGFVIDDLPFDGGRPLWNDASLRLIADPDELSVEGLFHHFEILALNGRGDVLYRRATLASHGDAEEITDVEVGYWCRATRTSHRLPDDLTPISLNNMGRILVTDETSLGSSIIRIEGERIMPLQVKDVNGHLFTPIAIGDSAGILLAAFEMEGETPVSRHYRYDTERHSVVALRNSLTVGYLSPDNLTLGVGRYGQPPTHETFGAYWNPKGSMGRLLDEKGESASESWGEASIGLRWQMSAEDPNFHLIIGTHALKRSLPAQALGSTSPIEATSGQGMLWYGSQVEIREGADLVGVDVNLRTGDDDPYVTGLLGGTSHQILLAEAPSRYTPGNQLGLLIPNTM